MYRYAIIGALTIAAGGCTCDVTRCGTHVVRHTQWRNYAIPAGAFVIKFSVPQTANGGMVGPPGNVDMELRSDPTADVLGQRLFGAQWTYANRANYSWPQGQGVSLYLHYSERPLDDLDALRAEMTDQELRYRARQPLAPDFPHPQLRFGPGSLAGRDGVHVRYPLAHPADVIIVDAHHYLSFAVGDAPVWPPWDEQAANIVAGIRQSIRVDPAGR